MCLTLAVPQLSHYLDVVEVSIARQISLRSEAFFHAMSSQHELQDRLQETQQAVAVLRRRTAAMDRVMCQGPLWALRSSLTRSNCVKLHNKLKLMAVVHQTQPTVQLLLSTSEFVGALELISTTKEVLQQELQGIHSFRYMYTLDSISLSPYLLLPSGHMLESIPPSLSGAQNRENGPKRSVCPTFI